MNAERLGVRHAALAVSDLDRAMTFYVDTLGFAPAYVADADWAMVAMGGTTLSLIPAPAGERPAPRGGSHPAHLGIVLDTPAAVDALYQRLRDLSLPRLGEPKRHRDGSYGFYLTDPDSNALECIFIPYRLQGAANPVPPGEAIILAASGVDPTGQRDALLARVRRHAWDTPVALAQLDVGGPDLAEVLPGLLAQGDIHRVRVVPLGLGSGDLAPAVLARHVAAVAPAFPHVTFVQESPIGDQALVQEAITAAICARIGADGPG